MTWWSQLNKKIYDFGFYIGEQIGWLLGAGRLKP